MAKKTEIIVPQLGESVSEATIASWHKKAGDHVVVDELLVELETDKVTLEINAQSDGTLVEIKVNEGEIVTIGDVIGHIEEGNNQGKAANDQTKPASTTQNNTQAISNIAAQTATQNNHLSPAPRKIIADNNLDSDKISGSGKDGRITKGDVLEALDKPAENQDRSVNRVKMSGLRKRVAERLKESQNTAAILSTFNEVDMSAIIAIRKKYKDIFQEKHDIKLGFMSFFVKACVDALKEIPAINAEIDGNDIIYKNYYDIGVAVGTKKGLVVPIIRNSQNLGLAAIEKEINNLAVKARDGKLEMSDLTGGTFTISNGGVYGSLLSTPIINPPQSGILGMHKMQERAVVVDGKIEIRPMMYLALSYDHRLIDGKEAVTFLIKVKESIEDPRRLLLDI